MKQPPSFPTFPFFVMVLLCFGCQSTPVVVNVANFVRPGAMATLCVDTGNETAMPLGACKDDTTANTLSPFAFVLQTDRGELAEINLETGAIVDQSISSPGYTFTPIGSLPVAIVVGENNPQCTFVVHEKSKDLWAMDTNALLQSKPATKSKLQLPAAPLDMKMHEPSMSLWITLRPSDGSSDGAGKLVKISFNADCTLHTNPETIPLAITAPFTPPLREPDVSLLCNAMDVPFESRFGNSPSPMDGPALPSTILIEGNDILVADSNLPLVHLISTTNGIDTPIHSSEPLKLLALTPMVSETANPSSPKTKQYLYASTQTTGQLAVFDWGAKHQILLNPFGPRGETFAFSTPITSLSVVTHPDNEICTDTSVDHSLELHGVFLFATLTNGTLQVVDIEDRNLTCERNAPLDCAGLETDGRFMWKRHRPRWSLRSIDNQVAVISPPTWSSNSTRDDNGFTASVDATGEHNIFNHPKMSPVSCEGATRVYGQILCASSNPWMVSNGNWSLLGRGALPQSPDRTVMPEIETADENGLIAIPWNRSCEFGVLSAEAARNFPDAGAGANYEFGYPGDLLAIKNPIVKTTPECAPFDEGVVYFRIERASEGTLTVIEQSLVADDITGKLNPNQKTWNDLVACADETLTMNIHADAYVVTPPNAASSNPQPLNPVSTVLEGARCVESGPLFSRFHRFRALPGRPYAGYGIALLINGNDVFESNLAFQITGQPSPLRLSLSTITQRTRIPSLPIFSTYVAPLQRVFVVDQNARRLININIDPFGVDRVYE